MSLSKIWVLGTNTFREAVRDRVFHSILFFAVGVVVFSLILKDVSIGDQDKVVRSVAQGGIDLFASVIAIFLGISLVWKELEKKTIYTILSKPISRPIFILGKYTGLMLTVITEVVILTILYTVMMTLQQDFPPTVFFVSIGLLIVELALLTAWATLFSAYSAPMTASAFTLAIFCIGHLADDLWLLGIKSEVVGMQNLLQILYWVLPNFEVLSIRDAAVHGRDVPWSQVLHSMGYGLVYTVIVLSGAVLIFQKKDIK
jgi:ABC-type transport system involved in multi-copper enzyme maturation permease subunit